MFSSRSTDNLAFVSRQLSQLLDRNDLEPALRKLAEASPATYSRDIEYLRGLVSGAAAPGPDLGPNPYRAIARLLPSVGSNRNALFREIVAWVQQSKVVFETYWAGIVGLTWYLAAVAAVALVVAGVFGAYVIPTFNDLFAGFGAQLPELTRTVFAFGRAGLPLFAVVLVLAVGAVGWVVALFHRRIQQLAPLPRWPAWAPIVGRLAEAYNLGLFLNYARILRSCGVDAQRAVADAASTSNQPDGLSYESLLGAAEGVPQVPVLTQLGVAARLGSFDSELSQQCEQHVGVMTLLLVEARDRFSLMLKIALYLFVATLVVAMYLPIFKMGSVI